VARHADDHAGAHRLEPLEEGREQRHLEPHVRLLEAAAGVIGIGEEHRRVDDSAGLLGALDEDGVGLEGIVAQREVPAVPLDEAEWDVDGGEGPESIFELAGPHQLHLDVGREGVVHGGSCEFVRGFPVGRTDRAGCRVRSIIARAGGRSRRKREMMEGEGPRTRRAIGRGRATGGSFMEGAEPRRKGLTFPV